MTTSHDFPGLRRFTPVPLKLRRPVPSDIEIAQEAKLKPITQVAEEVGLLPEEIELHGEYKAKVRLEVLDRLQGCSGWQIYRCDRHYAHAVG